MQTTKKILKVVLTIFTIISFIVTSVVGYIFITNYNQVGQLLHVATLVKSSYLHPITTEQLVEGATKGLVDSLGDEYSVFLDEKEFQKLQSYIEPTFGGIGVYVGTKEKDITVIAPVEGTPGHKAGIKSGDIITKIDGKSTTGMTLDDAVEVMRGEPGTKVKLSIKREGTDKILDFSIIREIVDVPTVKAEILKENKDIAYLAITLFGNNTDEEFTAEMEKINKEGYKGLIIDLRNNPGGNLETVVSILKEVLPESPIVHIVDKNGKSVTYSSKGPGIKVPLVVLVNEGSASASEIFAGAVKDTKLGTLVGEKTYGKGVVQNVFFLKDGAGLKLTTAKYLTPNKNDIHKLGIKPDEEVKLPLITGSEEFIEDTQLKKAIELLQGKL
ncbi:S41 family peptidase [Desulfonispora thiosulfatigenes]|uniref:S41 family peptidase n=1 Tax=Desulfonispora thiosulfatigenes TaxID=83661 RepID=UPI0009FC2CCC|nr:S41 family peptidase [Desulfonispora thiosulfatigenes]